MTVKVTISLGRDEPADKVVHVHVEDRSPLGTFKRHDTALPAAILAPGGQAEVWLHDGNQVLLHERRLDPAG